MSVTAINSFLAGASFGAALTAAGIYSPAIITSQLRLEDFLMLKTFLTASATSAIAIIIAQKLNYTTCKPRTPNTLGLFSSYDGNILGGALLGLGMALTGACPGTVIPQVIAGEPAGPFVLAGGFLGGILYSKYGKQLQKPSSQNSSPNSTVNSKTASSSSTTTTTTTTTIYEKANLTRKTGIIIYELLLLSAVLTLNILYPDNNNNNKNKLLIPSTLGGFLIGLSQFTTLFLTANTLGISSFYEQIGDVFWFYINQNFPGPATNTSAKRLKQSQTSFPTYQKTTSFALGTALGSWVINKAFHLSSSSTTAAAGGTSIEVVEISTPKALFGGAIMVIGARIAGGCTSGHGISGMSQLSIASVYSVLAMFGSGIIVSLFFL